MIVIFTIQWMINNTLNNILCDLFFYCSVGIIEKNYETIDFSTNC